MIFLIILDYLVIILSWQDGNNHSDHVIGKPVLHHQCKIAKGNVNLHYATPPKLRSAWLLWCSTLCILFFSLLNKATC